MIPVIKKALAKMPESKSCQKYVAAAAVFGTGAVIHYLTFKDVLARTANVALSLECSSGLGWASLVCFCILASS